MPGKAVEDDPDAWAPCTYVGNLEEASGPWLQPDSALTILAHLESKPEYRRSLFPSFHLSVTLSNAQISPFLLCVAQNLIEPHLSSHQGGNFRKAPKDEDSGC